MKTPQRLDFPAAHSMDSGWFAIDKTGALALFDTGETGAIPNSAVHLTGEAAVGTHDRPLEAALWVRVVAPWIARHVHVDDDRRMRWHRDEETWDELLVLFDSEARARDASKRLGAHRALVCLSNPLMLTLKPSGDPITSTELKLCVGFVGISPGAWGATDDVWAKVVPLVSYDNDWKPPGEYQRGSLGANVRLPDLPGDIEKIDVVFAETKRLHLADHYEQDECAVWGDKDLRTGG